MDQIPNNYVFCLRRTLSHKIIKKAGKITKQLAPCQNISRLNFQQFVMLSYF